MCRGSLSAYQTSAMARCLPSLQVLTARGNGRCAPNKAVGPRGAVDCERHARMEAGGNQC